MREGRKVSGRRKEGMRKEGGRRKKDLRQVVKACDKREEDVRKE